MKILITSTSAISNPPVSYGGLEWIAYNSGEEMAKFGHEVTIITTNDSPKLGIHEVVDEQGKSLGGVLDVKTAGHTGWGINHERDMYTNYREFMEVNYGSGQGVVFDHSWFGYPYLSQKGAREYLVGDGAIEIKPQPELKIVHVVHGTTG